jgi:putative membrane protein
MSSNLRRVGSVSLIAMGLSFCFAAAAQTTTPSTTRDTTTEGAGATSPTTGTGPGAAAGARNEDAGMMRGAKDDAKHDAKHGAMKNVSPQTFASQAAVIGKAEIELAQVALNNTKNEEIRLYAERMIKDHTAADTKLKKIAAKENLTLPQALDAEHRAVKDKLAGLKDAAFDREYRKEMAKGHDKAVALFESASQTEQMPEELREFAASTLDTLEDHREDAHDMQEKAQKRDGA